MGEDVHARGVDPGEERLVLLHRLVHEPERGLGELHVDVLHALAGQRAGVLAALLAPLAEARVLAGLVFAAGIAVQHAARAEALLELRVLRVIDVLRLLLGIEVVEVAEELVETVHRRQVLVAVAEMVLAELAGGVALGLQHFGEGHGLRLEAQRATRVTVCGFRPSGPPGRPTVVMPERIGSCPVMKAARPAVQLGWP
ncbi:hypothetical protein D3C78_1148070 [compost metagenome]